MRAGKLRDSITIQHKIDTPDAFGQPVSAWSDLATVWANVLFNNGKEAISSQSEVAMKAASMRIRWRTDIITGMRVIFNGETYNIKAVLPAQNREYLDLVADTGLNNG